MLNAEDVTLGGNLGSNGTLTVNGVGASATAQSLTIGVAGKGALSVIDGAQLTTNAEATLGATASANVDRATIDTLGLWKIADGLTVGESGIATVSVKGGGAIGAGGDVMLGDQAGSAGSLSLSGPSADVSTPSALSHSGMLTVGSYGDGTLNVTEGATVSAMSDGSWGVRNRRAKWRWRLVNSQRLWLLAAADSISVAISVPSASSRCASKRAGSPTGFPPGISSSARNTLCGSTALS